MISTAEALSGPWAANFKGWLWTAAPVSLLVVSQEISSGGHSWPSIFASAILQLLASAAWGGLVAGIARRNVGRVPTLASAILWIGFGLVRGLVGGAVALQIGLDPEWLYRIAFWTAISLTWIPLLTYTFAQWDERRRLLGVRATTHAALAEVAARAAESAETRQRRLAEAVDDAFRPALDEVRHALRQTVSSMDADTLESLRVRVEHLADRTSRFATPIPPAPILRADTRVSLSAASQQFELTRPVLAAALAAVATLPFLLPDALREGGLPHVAEVFVAIFVASTLLVAAFRLLRPIAPDAPRPPLSRVGVPIASFAGAAVLLLLPWEPFEPTDLILIAIFPLVFGTASSIVATAVALQSTNAEIESRAIADNRLLTQRLAAARTSEKRAAKDLVTLVRGELNGRLAGCAMALGFLASGTLPTASRDAAIRGIVAQLDAASDELSRVVAR